MALESPNPQVPRNPMTETAENNGYRALAGWYYAKLTNQADALVARVVGSVK